MSARQLKPVLLACLAASALCWPAGADIGGIGSPVVPSNVPKPAKPRPSASSPLNVPATAAVPAAQDEMSEGVERKPIMIIRFNQRHVYFERSLKVAIQSTERTKAGAFYNIVSYVPNTTSRSQNERISTESVNNLTAIVRTMRQLGVPASRIATTTDSTSPVAAQEVHIFVN